MTMRLDIVTNDAGELVRREHARELGANVVVSLYRLARLAQLHDLNNQAFVRQLEQTHQTIVDYCLRAGTHVSILFANRAVFVAGQLLKGSREKYDAATELGQIFEWCGGSELTIAREVTQSELLAFAEAISAAMRAEKGRGFRSPSPKIRLRAVNDAARVRGLDVERLSFEERIVRNYASAVVILRRFFDDLAASRYLLPRRIKRVAQNLVDLSIGSTPAFLGVTEVRNANHDDAGRAVNTAILAVAMAREITEDKVTLAHIAMASMMHDVGRPRASALASGGGGPRVSQVVARLSEDAEDRLPAGTAAVLTALGRVNEPSITRTVLAFEALWLRRAAYLGPVYRGARAATLHARIITIARRYNDLVTPEPGLDPRSPDVAIAILSEELTEPADRTLLRMLVSALGLFPVGTVVQLSTGEVAEVVFGADVKTTPGKPRLRIVMDAHGGVLASPLEIDLAEPAHAATRALVRVMSVDGWRKGKLGESLDRAPPRPRQTQEPSAPSRSAVVPTEPRMPVATPVPPRPTPAPPPLPVAVPPRPIPRAPLPSVPEASVGTTPSAVAEAMGRMIEDALRGAPPPGSPVTPAPPPPPAPEDTAKYAAQAGPTDRPPVKDITVTEPNTVAPAPREPSPPTPTVMKAAQPVSLPPASGPTARGTLGVTPLAHVLVYMLDHALSGSVVFSAPDADPHFISFQNGAPFKVRIAHPAALIGDELVAAGVLRREVLPEALEGAQRLGVLLGEYLVGHDMVTRAALAEALEAQVGNKVASIVNLEPDTVYSFYRDVDLLPSLESEVAVGDPLNVILATVRAWHDRARIRATLARIQKHRLVFHTQADPLSLALTPPERAVVETIRAEGCTLSQLFQMRMADEEAISSLVYTFAVTRQFAFKGQKKPPMGGRAAIPISIAPPTSTQSAPSMRVSQPHESTPASFAEARAEEVEPPLAANAMAESAPSDAIDEPSRDSVEPTAKVNDRRPSIPPHSTWRPPPVITMPPPLVRTDRPSSPGEGGPDEIGGAEGQLEAMTHFRLAEASLQRGDVAQAERLAKKATLGDPEEGDYAALYTWIRAMGTHNDAGVIEAITTLSKIIDNTPTERALLYRGKLWKRIKKMREALRDFQAVLTMNPRHREAASEVRLLKQSRGR
jgi:tetratricopeptide (TPR) repeat protein